MYKHQHNQYTKPNQHLYQCQNCYAYRYIYKNEINTHLETRLTHRLRQLIHQIIHMFAYQEYRIQNRYMYPIIYREMERKIGKKLHNFTFHDCIKFLRIIQDDTWYILKNKDIQVDMPIIPKHKKHIRCTNCKRHYLEEHHVSRKKKYHHDRIHNHKEPNLYTTKKIVMCTRCYHYMPIHHDTIQWTTVAHPCTYLIRLFIYTHYVRKKEHTREPNIKTSSIHHLSHDECVHMIETDMITWLYTKRKGVM